MVTAPKDMLAASVLGLSHFKFLSIPFALGIVLLFLSLVLPWLPISCRCFCLDGAPLHAISGRNQRREASQKDMFKVSIFLITVADIAIDVNLIIGLSHFKFLSILYAVVVYAMFALGMVLLILSLIFPRLPISCRCFCLDGALLHAISGRNQRREASQKDMIKVSVFLITIAAIAIDVNLSIGLSDFKFFSIPYVVVVYAIFAWGIVLLLLSLVLQEVPASCRCLRLDGTWHHAIGGRNQRRGASQKDMSKVSVFLITVATIAIDVNLPIGLSHFKFFPIPYVVVIYAVFALGIVLLLLSLVLPGLPISCRCLCLDSALLHAISGRNQRREASQKSMFKVSILLITVAAIMIDANLPIHVPLSIPYIAVIYAMFALGTVLLLLSLVLPKVPASCRCLHLDGASHHTIGGRNQRHEASQKNMFKVSVLLITVAAIAIDTNLPIGLPHFKFLSIPYAVVIYAMFALGTLLLLLSLVLPKVPTSYRCLHLDGVLHHAICGRNQRHEASQKNMFKVSVLLITVAAIAIDTNLPISFSHFKFLSIPYAVVIYAMFALGTVLLLLSLVLPQVPTSPRCLHLDGAGHHAINESNQCHEAIIAISERNQ